MATVSVPQPFRSPEEASPCGDQDAQPPGKPPTRVAKKRTKTGCLTCRRRRIKCDELQPICRNCTKSRRLCQYTKYTFRDQTAGQRPAAADASHAGQGANFMFAQATTFGQVAGITGEAPATQPIQHNLAPPFAPLRPRAGGPSMQYDTPSFELLPTYHSQPWSPFAAGNQPLGVSSASAVDDAAGSTSAHPPPPVPTSLEPYHSTHQPDRAPPAAINTHFDPSAMPNLFPTSGSSPTSAYPYSTHSDYSRGSHSFSPFDASPLYDGAFRPSQPPQGFLLADHTPSSGVAVTEAHANDQARRRASASVASTAPQHNFMLLSRSLDPRIHDDARGRELEPQDFLDDHDPLSATRDVNQALTDAAIEAQDDDYFDILSDEDGEDDEATRTLGSVHTADPSDLQVMNSLYHHSGLLRQRGIHAFIYPGIIDHYRAERVASPLRNDATARVFAHFASSTGPMLSPFERVARADPALVEMGAMPTSHLSLWTFTLPMRALHSQGLLHAMLAMASLHIARLQSASTTPSYLHYSWSVKRVHKAVGKRQNRHDVSILAATLLLAFYEVMTADLVNWIPHLCGARQLILDIDFVGMARQIAERKAERDSQPQSHAHHPFIEHPTDPFIDRFPVIDDSLVAVISGRQWQRASVDQTPVRPSTQLYSNVQLSDFEVLQDLHWWYLKQDMVQSAISGDPPLMHYSHWTRCPPRAPLGARGAVYGSFDYILLLIGRICDFTSRDVSRKVRWNEANGRPWPRSSFYGMAPAAAAHMPRVFCQDGPVRPTAESQEVSRGLQAQTDWALQEWADIESSFDILESGLAVPGYLPLSEDEMIHYNTPFGRVIHYSSYNLAVLFMWMHMGRLMLSRCHPSMPPSIAMAVGCSAASTASRASMIGRIAAGITPLLNGAATLSAQLAGTFTDCTLPLFFAGVQYHDPLQRYWTVTRLLEIEERSGWASAGLCANGCETAWEKAGESGAGPPYTRVRPANSVAEAQFGATAASSIFEAASRVALGTPEASCSVSATPRMPDDTQCDAGTTLPIRGEQSRAGASRGSFG